MENNIESLLSNFDQLISYHPQNLDFISSRLRELEEKIQQLEECNQVQYGYYKYAIAQRTLNHLKLNTKQEIKYQSHIDKFEKEYESYLNESSQQNYESSFEQQHMIEDLLKEKESVQKDKQQKVFLIFGKTGVGKSSLIQKITGDKSAETSNRKESLTQECRIFEKNGRQFIDSPGINDTQRNRYEVLLKIAKYLYDNELKLEDIFIISVYNKELNQLKSIQEFSYTYFLYELFKNQINYEEVEQLVYEYFQSSCLLNWSECGFHQLQDRFSQKRQMIFSKRDLASNYFQYLNTFHIRVRTFFDKTIKEDLKEFDENIIEYLKEQIWSDKCQENIFFKYNEYIKTQEYQLFKKIEQITQLELQNQISDEDYQIQNILLIGESQVGKSSLIEQLIQLKGIRGSGKQSETSVCQIYCVNFENTRYRFIDTPGYEGTETNQNPFHSFKIIADYLRRNQIKEIKLLYICDPSRDIRDTSIKVLNQLSIFIKYMFDQDISFIDTQYLNVLQCGIQSEKWERFLQQNVLQIYREQTGSEASQTEEIDQRILQQNLKTVKFSSNFYTKKGQFIKVDKQKDLKQKNILFKAINEIEYISIEDKILLKIKQTYQSVLITDTQTYLQAYKDVEKIYIELYQQNKLIRQLTEENQSQNYLIALNEKKIQLTRELEQKLFRVGGSVYNSEQIQQYKLTSSREMNLELRNKAENDIQRHFVIFNYDPILYESGPEQNTFLSRKQLYFSTFSHQLKRFIKNRKHDEKLELLAEIKVAQEFTFHQYQNQKFIESNYDKDPQNNIESLLLLSQGLNKIFGTGIYIYRYATYFSSLAEARKVISMKSIIGFWVNSILFAISIGIDIYSYQKGHIGTKQFRINTFFNTISGFISLASHMIPGCGLAVGGIASSIALANYVISRNSLKFINYPYTFTSSQTFDETISKFMKNIMDDNMPNQQLLYFQKSELLKQQFNFTHYSQLSQKQGYEMFRKLEIQNYNEQFQKNILLHLYGLQNESNLLDLISQYIVNEFILNKFKVEFQQQAHEDNLQFLKRIKHELNENQQLINIFFNRFDQTVQKNITQSCQQALKSIQNSLKYNQNLQLENYNVSNQMKLDNQELQIVQTYIDHVKQFQQQIKNSRQGNGSFSRAGHFSILLNSYCNLMQLKIQYKYEQPIISELQKDPINKRFIVREDSMKTDIFAKDISDDDLINYLNLLCISEKYINNRYLQKIKGEKEPNLTSISESEILDCKLEYSLDLHDLFESSKNYLDFLQSIKSQTNYNFNNDVNMRIKHFYESIIYLNEYFN